MDIKILKGTDPERYYCRLVDGNSGRQAFEVILQVNDDNETCMITSCKASTRAKSIARTHYEGTVNDLCIQFLAFPNGILLPEVAFKRWIQNNIVKIMTY